MSNPVRRSSLPWNRFFQRLGDLSNVSPVYLGQCVYFLIDDELLISSERYNACYPAASTTATVESPERILLALIDLPVDQTLGKLVKSLEPRARSLNLIYPSETNPVSFAEMFSPDWFA